MNANEISVFSERLLLKGIEVSDAESIFKYRSDPEIYKFQYWRPKSIQEVEDFLTNKVSRAPNIPDTWYQVGIFLKETHELIGDIGIHFIDDENSQVEIGYTLSPESQGRGYASEAVICIIDYLFNELNKHRITASVDPRNVKSIALLKRIGMRKEAHFKKSILFDGDWADDIVYAILEEEWKMRNTL